MTVAIAILGGFSMFFVLVGVAFLLLTLIDDFQYFAILGYGVSSIIAWILLIPIYVLAISGGAGLWTIIIGSCAMAGPLFLLLVYLGVWPFILLNWAFQISLFILALLKV